MRLPLAERCPQGPADGGCRVSWRVCRAKAGAHQSPAGGGELGKTVFGGETVTAFAGGQVLRIVHTRDFHPDLTKASFAEEMPIVSSSGAPAIQPAHSSMLLRSSTGYLGTTTSETAKRPPGLRHAKRLAQHPWFVGAQVDDAVGNEDVDAVSQSAPLSLVRTSSHLQRVPPTLPSPRPEPCPTRSRALHRGPWCRSSSPNFSRRAGLRGGGRPLAGHRRSGSRPRDAAQTTVTRYLPSETSWAHNRNVLCPDARRLRTCSAIHGGGRVCSTSLIER